MLLFVLKVQTLLRSIQSNPSQVMDVLKQVNSIVVYVVLLSCVTLTVALACVLWLFWRRIPSLSKSQANPAMTRGLTSDSVQQQVRSAFRASLHPHWARRWLYINQRSMDDRMSSLLMHVHIDTFEKAG